MKILDYLQYFFYIALNWNIRLAIFVIYHEIKGEKKHGINTTGYDELKTLQQNGIDISHATIYMPVNYYLLNKAFEQINIPVKNNFVDIGCGKGRALVVAANNGFKKVTGVDFSEKFCAIATENLQFTQQLIPLFKYDISTIDAANFEIPKDADCIFLFNPFDETIMQTVVHNIKKSVEQLPRNIEIIYANPLYKKLFIAIGFRETYHFTKMHYLEISILSISTN